MNRIKTFAMGVLLALTIGPLAAWLGSGAAAQGTGTLNGQVFDDNGKPFYGVTIVIKDQAMGQTYQVPTDKNGRFVRAGLRGGVYMIDVVFKGQTVYETQVQVPSGGQVPLTINFKEIKSSAIEAMKKQEEERQKFANLKGHFDAGVASLEQAKQVHTQMMGVPADQRAALQQKLDDLAGTAVTEFSTAEKSASEKDPNLHLIEAKLGESYETEGKYQEAADAYQKAIALKPEPGYYNNLGNVLARLGKIDDARTAYEKSAELDPANAATAWRNFGIVLYNASRMKDAIEPLRKATELDPKSAQAWYLLGAALVGAMGFKQEGDKVIPILQPGTVEAYQKCIEVDPKGPYAAQAEQGLEQLKAMGLGIETKVGGRPPKKKKP